jgi:hypothetical protein
MNLYLDDDSASARLATALRNVGHTAAVPADFGIAGVSDPRHLICAIQNDLILLTRNYRDFLDLHDLARARRRGAIWESWSFAWTTTPAAI